MTPEGAAPPELTGERDDRETTTERAGTSASAPDRTNERLRILIVLEATGGGSGRHVIDLCRGLLKKQHNVSLAWSPNRAEEQFRREIAEIRGLETFEIPMTRAPGLADLDSVRALRKLIRECGGFDILHGHSSKAGALVRLAGTGLAGRKFYTPHAMVTLDPDLGILKRGIYSLAERLLARLADQIICVSEEESSHACEVGIPAKKLAVVHNGLDPATRPPNVFDRLWARKQLGLADDDIVIGTVGRLTHQKATDRLIRAFGMACHNDPRMRLLIVGDGPEMAGLQTLAREIGLSGHVIFAGSRNGPDMMPAFDVFALSSRYEGFPYVLLEAGLNELPIVMMNAGGADAMLADGQCGFAVPQGNLNLLASGIAHLARDAGERESMGQAARARALELSVETMVDNTLAIYLDALENSPAEEQTA